MAGHRILTDWSPKQGAALGHEVLVGRHALAAGGAFEDDALVELIEAHPSSARFVYVMGRDKTNYAEWKLAETPDMPVRELLDTIRAGLLWLNLLNLEAHHASWRVKLDDLYDELEAGSPGFRAVQRHANLIVSSPRAMVHYHADAECNLLWHLRGRKRVWVYPVNERFAPQRELERIFAREKEEDLPYDPSFDESAACFDLEPGQLVTWPQNSPHRVENTEGLNVSLSTMHYTPEALRRERVFLANRHFRSRLPFRFESTETAGLGPAVKGFAFRGLRKLGLVADAPFRMPRTVRIDPDSPSGYRELG